MRCHLPLFTLTLFRTSQKPPQTSELRYLYSKFGVSIIRFSCNTSKCALKQVDVNTATVIVYWPCRLVFTSPKSREKAGQQTFFVNEMNMCEALTRLGVPEFEISVVGGAHEPCASVVEANVPHSFTVTCRDTRHQSHSCSKDALNAFQRRSLLCTLKLHLSDQIYKTVILWKNWYFEIVIILKYY